jgi:hypothetical protein
MNADRRTGDPSFTDPRMENPAHSRRSLRHETAPDRTGRRCLQVARGPAGSGGERTKRPVKRPSNSKSAAGLKVPLDKARSISILVEVWKR